MRLDLFSAVTRGVSQALCAARCAGLVACGAGLSLSCGGDSYGDAPGSGLQASVTLSVGPPTAEVLLLVVDDRPDALELSTAVANALDSLTARRVEPQCGSLEDPATWHPIDWSVVVVHPSASGDAIYTSPADDAGLRWVAKQRTESSRATFVAAARAALALQPDPPGPFAALDAFHRSLALLSKQREAETAAEMALLASLPAEYAVEVTLALAHEDESAEPPEDYAVSLAPNAALSLGSVTVPAVPSPSNLAACTFSLESSSARLDPWLVAQGVARWALWPCTGLSPFARPSDDLACEPQKCVTWRALEQDDGGAECLVLVDSQAESCDPAFGWLDPQAEDGVRRPLVTETKNATVRTCEIRQLTGSALAACQGELACSGCEAGWCVTRVPELSRLCNSGQPLPLRFPGGADAAAPGLATVICNATRP